jgi:FK506-binding protein 1
MPEELRKEVVREGNGTDKPKAGDTVTMDYTGWLEDKNEPDNRGKV